MIIGLTGTIGSGKSLVAGVLEKLGAVVIDTDIIAREAVAPGTTGWQGIVDNWGEEILLPDRTIDRKKLAQIVFTDEVKRITLNSLLHPIIAEETAKKIAMAPQGKVIVLVVPLLFESGLHRLAQQIWVVIGSEDALVDRICRRDGATREHALDRIRSQMPQKEKAARADVVIDNSGTIENTEKQVREAFLELGKK